MKKKKIISIIIISVFVVFGIVKIFYLNSSDGIDCYMFASISECEKFESPNLTNGSFTKYNSPNDDTYLKSMQYASFYAGKYVSEELDFEIYAYQFNDVNDAKEYFKNATGKTINTDSSFSSSSGFRYYRLTAFDGVNAYTVIAEKSQLEEINNILNNVFSKKMT